MPRSVTGGTGSGREAAEDRINGVRVGGVDMTHV